MANLAGGDSQRQFIRSSDRAGAIAQLAGSIARVPIVAGEPILAAAREAGPLLLALRSITDVNAVETASADQLNMCAARAST